jgi:hypothetical protein
LGILLTVWLIDAVIQKNEQTNRERVVKVAFSQMSLPLRRHVTMLLGMYKAALAHAPQTPPQTLQELFGPDYVVQLAFLDLSKPAPILGPIPWYNYLHSEIGKFQAALSRTIEKYATFLDPETVELIEAIIGDSLLAMLSQVHAIPYADQQLGFQRRQFNLLSGQGMADMVRQHTDLVIRLAEHANEKLSQEKQVAIGPGSWRNDVAPQFGSSRIPNS